MTRKPTALTGLAGRTKPPGRSGPGGKKEIYTPADVDPGRFSGDVGSPGEFPFTRGIYPTMYLGRPWTIRQYAGFGTARETNERFRFLLEQGQTGLSVAFDLPTQIGYDSDDPLAEGEVGRVGVAVDSIADMRILFDGIPLEKISTSMTINATAMILLALYVALADEQGIDRRELAGTIQNDILKEYIARGTYLFPPGPSMRLVTDTFDWCAENVPNWNPVSISGYHIREAGSTRKLPSPSPTASPTSTPESVPVSKWTRSPPGCRSS
jgi:methylmalonyl-CoA mutase N-terminal domain/subunit